MVHTDRSAIDLPVAVFSLLGSAGAEVETVLTGTSMSPTLPDGCRIRVQAGKRASLTPGQIVLVAFARDQGFAHRVVAVGRGPRARDYVITRGDATPRCDRPVHIDQVLGVVTHYSTDSDWLIPEPGPSFRGRRGAWARGSELGLSVLLELNVRLAERFAAMLAWAGPRIGRMGKA